MPLALAPQTEESPVQDHHGVHEGQGRPTCRFASQWPLPPFRQQHKVLLWGISPSLLPPWVSWLPDLFREEQMTQREPRRPREGGAEAFPLQLHLGRCEAGAGGAGLPQGRSCLLMEGTQRNSAKSWKERHQALMTASETLVREARAASGRGGGEQVTAGICGSPGSAGTRSPGRSGGREPR